MGISFSCLKDDEYGVYTYPGKKKIKTGPGCKWYVCGKFNRKKKLRLDANQYILIKKLEPDNEEDDIMEIISGPCLYRPKNAYVEIIGDIKKKLILKKNNFLVVTNKDGNKRIEKGPKRFVPEPYDRISNVMKMIDLTDVEYVIVENKESGDKRIEVGKQLFCPGPYDIVSDVKKMIVLNDNQYLYVTHTDTGKISIVVGPNKFTPGPHDIISRLLDKIVLKHDEYIKIIDKNTGKIRVVKGPATVILKQYEKTISNIKKAVEINEHNAVYIFDTKSGDYELVQMEKLPFMFFPSETQEVVEKREKIRLEKHEAVVIVDRDGKYYYKYGTDKNSAFFLPPYCKLLVQDWSSDLEKDHQQIQKISRFDLRPQYMNFKFMIRTSDNVEIWITLNFYWKIFNVERMVSTTEDAPEDICKHAMSQILSDSSRKTMQEFMESFNEIVQGAIEKDDGFYEERGVKILRVEITGRKCDEDDVEKNFQAIIREKTERIRKLEEKTGENEVTVRDLEGKLKAEDLKGKLIRKQIDCMREEAKADGEYDADRIKNFFDNLPSGLTAVQKMEIYMDRQNTERIEFVSKNVKNMTLIPKDLDIKLVIPNPK